MLNGAIIKRKATTGTYKIAIDDDKNRLLVATWDHLDQSPVWERCPHSLLDEDAVDYFVTAHKELNLSDQEYDFLEKYQSMKLSQRFGNVFDRLKNDKSKAIYTHDGSIQLFYIQGKRVDKEEWDKLHRS